MILNDDQRMIREMARSFARDQLTPFAAKRDFGFEFPRAALIQMGELGLLGMLVPPEYDGAGVDHVSYARQLAQ